jgi:hypothetical protein
MTTPQPDPKAIASRILPRFTTEGYGATLAGLHALIIDQMVTIGMTVQVRLTAPAPNQPQAAARSIDAPEYAVSSMARAIRDLSLAAQRLTANGQEACNWANGSSLFGNVNVTERFTQLATAVTERALSPAVGPTVLASTSAAPQTPDTKGNTLPFPARRAKH